MIPKDLLALILPGALWGGSFLFIRVGTPVLGPLVLTEFVTYTPSVRSIEPPRLSIASMTGRIVRAGVG